MDSGFFVKRGFGIYINKDAFLPSRDIAQALINVIDDKNKANAVTKKIKNPLSKVISERILLIIVCKPSAEDS